MVRGLLNVLRQYETLLYLLLAFALLVFLQRAWRAWNAVQEARFQLELEEARHRFVQNTVAVFLCLALMLGVFLGAALADPEYSQLLFATPIPTLPVDGATPTPEATPTPTPLPEVVIEPEACVPGQVEITEPQNDATLQGKVTVRGSAAIPNFAFYKLDVAPRSTPLFLTIAVGREPVVKGVLMEEWDTTLLTPGDYLLQLVVVDTFGETQPPCRILVHIQAAP